MGSEHRPAAKAVAEPEQPPGIFRVPPTRCIKERGERRVRIFTARARRGGGRSRFLPEFLSFLGRHSYARGDDAPAARKVPAAPRLTRCHTPAER